MGDLRLSLEHMTVLGMRPADIVAAAEQLDVPLISLILDSGPYPLDLASFLVSPALTGEISARLAGSARMLVIRQPPVKTSRRTAWKTGLWRVTSW